MHYLRKILRIEPGVALGWWLYERVSVSWPLLVGLTSGGVMSWLSIATDWITPWGPAVWFAAGLATFLGVWGSLTLIRMGISWKRVKDQLSLFSEKQLSSTSINPLDQQFLGLRLNAWDFYHPYFERSKEKTFRNCEIMGPCNVALLGNSSIPRARFRECDFVIVNPEKPVHGVVAFEDCSFLDCAFYRVTFFMPAVNARDIKRQILANGTFEGDHPLNVITDGQYGEI